MRKLHFDPESGENLVQQVLDFLFNSVHILRGKHEQLLH